MTTLSIQQARAIFDAAESRAREMGIPMVIAIVDAHQNPLLVGATDGALLASWHIAQAIAEPVIAFNSDGAAMKPYENAPWYAGVPLRCGMRPIPGESGLRIVIDGELIGAIGVSGGSGPQDRSCAVAGLRAIGMNVE